MAAVASALAFVVPEVRSEPEASIGVWPVGDGQKSGVGRSHARFGFTFGDLRCALSFLKQEGLGDICNVVFSLFLFRGAKKPLKI